MENKQDKFFIKKVNIIKQFIKQEFLKYNIYENLIFDLNFKTNEIKILIKPADYTKNIKIIKINNPNPNTDIKKIKNAIYDFIKPGIEDFKKYEIIKNLFNTIYKKQIEDKEFEIFLKYDFFEAIYTINIIIGKIKSNFDYEIDENFKSIQKKINRFLEVNKNNKKNECLICYNKFNKCLVCSKCANDTCFNCFLEIIEKNKGLHKCPFCCYERGEKLNKEDLKQHIKNLKLNLNTSIKRLDNLKNN